MRRMEDKIRNLCKLIVSAKGDDEANVIVVELREALHQHIERLRERVADYPIVTERRSQTIDTFGQSGTPLTAASITRPPNEAGQGSAARRR
jgi:hypothetical protein